MIRKFIRMIERIFHWDEFGTLDPPPPSPETRAVGEGRGRMQLASGYYNSFDVVIGALETGGEQAQAAGHIAHGACLLYAAAELRHVWDERKSDPCDPVVDEGRG